MTDPVKPKRLEKWIWLLIYGGMFAVVLGIFTQREAENTGWTMIVLGVIAAVIGVALIFVRARMKPD